MLNATAGMRGKLQSPASPNSLFVVGRFATTSGNCHSGRTRSRSRARRRRVVGGESIFLSALLQVHRRRDGEAERRAGGREAGPHRPSPSRRRSVPLLPRGGRCGVSFRVSSEPCYFGKRWIDGVKLCVSDDRDGRRPCDTARRGGNCTSEANLRVLRFNFSERH